jgi:hypothetical protein
MRTLLLSICAIVFFLSGLAAGCTADKEEELMEEIRGEAVYCLVKMNEVATEKMDLESYSVGQKLEPVILEMEKLRQVAVPALEWVELQSDELPQKQQKGDWRIEVTENGLAEFKNDKYRISHLEFQAYNIGEEEQNFSYIVKVTELATNKEKDLETIYDELEQQKVGWEERLQLIGDKRMQSAWTCNAVIRLWQDWQVQKIDENTYLVIGPGLGISESKPGTPGLELDKSLIAGEWTYYRDSGEIVPADKQSSALQNILSGNF